MGKHIDLSAKVLGQISLIQSVVAQLPNEKTILDFLANGLSVVPGVKNIIYNFEESVEFPDEQVFSFHIKHMANHYAYLIFFISDRDLFNIYIPFLENLSNMIGLIFKEKSLSRKNDEINQKITQLLTEKELILEHIGLGITHIINNEFVWANRGFLNITKFPAELLIGSSTKIIFQSDEQWNEIKQSSRSAFKTGDTYKKELILQRKDNTPFWARIIGNALNTEDSSQGVIWIVEDISLMKDTEKKLKLAKSKAETANRAKSEFLANMSHEIRTPMNAILGFSEILKEKLHEYGLYDEYLNGILAGGKNLLRLIDDILDLSKVESGKIEIFYDIINIQSFLDEIYQIFSIRIKEKGLKLNINIDANIDYAVLLDETRLRQIFFNLVGNAVKFTNKGEVTISLRTSKIPGSENINLAFEIADTGIGIPGNELKSIFEPFRQRKGQKYSQFKGTGLGLAISKKLVELMHGTISVTSEVKKGTTFRIEFDNVGLTGQSISKTNIESKVLPNIQFTPCNILYAEDILSNRQVVRAFLSSYDIELFEATNGQEAIEVINKVKVDLILMDIEMPVMNGIKAAKKIREDDQFKQIPIIALTATVHKSEEKGHPGLFDDMLRKPVSKYKLINKLMKYLKYEIHDDIALPEKDIDAALSQDDLNKFIANSPKGLIEQFREHIRNEYDAVKDTYSVNECLVFSEKTIKYAEENKAEILLKYGLELQQSIKKLDFDKIEFLVNIFNVFYSRNS